MVEIEFAQITDVGKVRGHNEDYLGYVLPESEEQTRTHGWLFAVADGVGGQDLGEVASRLAVESLQEGFRRAASGESHSNVLQRLVQSANTRIYEAGKKASAGGVAMATTVVACALRFDRVVVAHVGDSRCYLIRRGHTTQLTRDHTVVNDQVRLGVMSAKEATEASTRHLLTRSLGNDLFVNVDVNEHQVLPGDVLLLCSDGLHGAIPAEELADIVSSHPNLEYAASKLIDLANQRDGADNVTLQLIHVLGVERIGMYRGRPYKLR